MRRPPAPSSFSCFHKETAKMFIVSSIASQMCGKNSLVSRHNFSGASFIEFFLWDLGFFHRQPTGCDLSHCFLPTDKIEKNKKERMSSLLE